MALEKNREKRFELAKFIALALARLSISATIIILIFQSSHWSVGVFALLVTLGNLVRDLRYIALR